ncbi:hypothetical protein CEP51_013564 [Fusarium floridanum]|uniref:GIT Spa2 homology (SHD) domain-containing protein n=1 Tax=Fusarium floridanum TaxID=1325733 RepID=A0A428Q983_9HYPO|nr:hypothetical protein CEP51_013564 [Fusarium floridanum]
MSISERHNVPVPAVLLSGTKFSVSQGQPVDDGRYSRGSSNLASVPNSAGSNNYTRILGSPAAPRNNGGPSSSASSSITTGVHARPYLDEIILNEHYLAFRVVLDTSDPKDKQQHSKSNPKLLRLTPSQLYQLSTDVFDELMRRQAPASPNGPAFLLPNNAFSSRRNQARQRLSAIGPPRFRDLVADVAYEINLRFPYFARAYLEQTGNRTSTQGDIVSTRSSTLFNIFVPRRQSLMNEPTQAPSMMGPIWTDVYRFPLPPSAPHFSRSPSTNGDYSPTPKQPYRENANVPKRLSKNKPGAAGRAQEALAAAWPRKNDIERLGYKRVARTP